MEHFAKGFSILHVCVNRKEGMNYLVRKQVSAGNVNAWKLRPDIYIVINLQMDNPKGILLSKDSRHMWLQWNHVQ